MSMPGRKAGGMGAEGRERAQKESSGDKQGEDVVPPFLGLQSMVVGTIVVILLT